ncbi:uncharacterized protein LOC122310867 [Carya illinoinensis]|uniref:Bromo domain-containing protein n=1 Tax=Carya illinoinensis TaxID=32201 RepID=A0A8T1QHM2_CARIL|nr:uncharacterized protein LOC122310867 [Carya illinoinensis]KAG6653662.1 hypothetical protein CIPAW_05G092400 [Carya illinoinensis]
MAKITPCLFVRLLPGRDREREREMGKIVERKKKKKGRPSLLDLQKRTLKEQQQQQPQQPQQHQKRSHSSAPHSTSDFRTAPSSAPTPLRRSTRRNPNPHEDDDDDDEEDEFAGRRREKKLKLVLRLPSQKSSPDSGASPNSSGSDSNAEDENESNAASNSGKKRKINAIGNGSGLADCPKVDKSISGANPTSAHQGGDRLASGPSTSLPDKKLLQFILDRLQKKDTYGVFSEPVDPNELPDYHEVIEHPMDFQTVRGKLAGGAYANLEQFEKDVFLICSNAMQYNAPDTIYFRQARSIQELAKKNFENLRQDSDDNEPEPKIVRRGRPPTKNLKKSMGKPSLERAGSEFSTDDTLVKGAENTNWSNYDLRKGTHLADKSALADWGSRNNDVYTSWLVDNKLDRNDERAGSMMKGNQMKHGKKQVVLDDNRRKTYKQSQLLASGRELSVLTTFDGERKQLMAVGLPSELGYARSLARFAANLGPVAWKVASKKIERSLPAGVKFGRGWVGENDVTPLRPLLLPSSLPNQPLPSQSFPLVKNTSSTANPCTVESRGDALSGTPEGNNFSEKHVPSTHSALDGHLSKHPPPSATTSSSPFSVNKSAEPLKVKAEVAEGLGSHTGINILNSSSGAIKPRPSFQIHPNTLVQPGLNGLNGSFGFNIAAQRGKLIGAGRPAEFNLQSPQMLDTISRTNTNLVHMATTNSLNSEDSKIMESSTSTNSGGSLRNSGSEALAAQVRGLHSRPSWQGLSPQQKTDSGLSPPQQKQASIPPDLNVRFQSPGSPSSSRVDSTHPDLALQL